MTVSSCSTSQPVLDGAIFKLDAQRPTVLQLRESCYTEEDGRRIVKTKEEHRKVGKDNIYTCPRPPDRARRFDASPDAVPRHEKWVSAQRLAAAEIFSAVASPKAEGNVRSRYCNARPAAPVRSPDSGNGVRR